LPEPSPVALLLGLRAAATPDVTALVVEGSQGLTYGDWHRRSDAIAAAMVQRGVGGGDRVVLVFDAAHWTDCAVAYAAIHKTGAVTVVLGPQPVGLALARVVDHCGATAAIGSPGLAPAGSRAWVASPQELEEDGAGAPVTGPRPPRPGPIEMVVTVGALCAPISQEWSSDDVAADGRPPMEAAGGGPPTMVCSLRMGSVLGQQALRLPLRSPAGALVVLAGFHPAGFWEAVARHRAGAVALDVAMAGVVIGTGGPGGDGSSVRRVMLSGEADPPLRAAIAAAFPNARSVEVTAGGASPGATGRFATSEPSPPRCAPVQEALLWHEQLAPGCMNLQPLARLLEGPLDVAALGAALDELSRRHEPLRTTFELSATGATQVVGDPPARPPAVVDLSGLAPTERDAMVVKALAEAQTEPVDLVAGPVFRPRLLRLAADAHLLVVPVHHLFWDDWSEAVFKRELSAVYAAYAAGRPSPLPEVALRFTEVAARRQDALSSAAGRSQREYWRAKLAGAALVTQLPLHDPELPPGSPQPPSGPLSTMLDTDLSSRLRDLVRRHRSSLFITMLSAFSVVASRILDRDDLLLSSVAANRSERGTEDLIGCFAKKILLRVDLASDPTFTELVGRVRRVVLEALANQDVPYETALQEALGARAARHGLAPSVGILFQGLAPSRARVTLPGLEARRFRPPSLPNRRRHFASGIGGGTVNAWGAGIYLGCFLRVVVFETRNGIACEAWGAFHAPAVERLMASFAALLGDVVADPDRPISEFAVADLPHAAAGGTAGGIDLGGLTVSPSLIEAALSKSPAVDDVAVVAMPDASGQPELVAYVVAPPPAPTLAALHHLVWAQLPGYAWPAAAVLVDAIPRRPDGGVDVGALPAPRGPGSGRLVPAGDPTPEQALLTSLWGHKMGSDSAAVEDNYWQQLPFLDVATSAAHCGLAVTAPAVAANRTIETLAAAVRADHERSGGRRKKRLRQPISAAGAAGDGLGVGLLRAMTRPGRTRYARRPGPPPPPPEPPAS